MLFYPYKNHLFSLLGIEKFSSYHALQTVNDYTFYLKLFKLNDLISITSSKNHAQVHQNLLVFPQFTFKFYFPILRI